MLVPFPRLEWALAAIDDLRREGCVAELMPWNPRDTTWSVRVGGSPDQIAVIRREVEPAPAQVCWEEFVNGLMAGHLD